MKVYLAGPLLVPKSQELLEEIDKICKEFNLDTFLPHRDVGVYKSGEDSKKYFKGDMEPLNECAFMIAILDWKGISSGTAWEIGYAYSKGMPIIGLVEDIESLNREERMCVMCYNSVILVDSLEKLKEEIRKLI
jgi:nucleoside 2-deoxyribosyltransferase